MKKVDFLLVMMFGIIMVFALSMFALQKNSFKRVPKTINAESEGVGSEENPNARAEYEFNRLKNPETGKIPQHMHNRELEFARKLPKNSSYSKDVEWINRGPFNVGGRTRACAIDVVNENRFLAGGVSGGLWISENSGSSWSKITPTDHVFSVSCIAQDTRTGKTDTWYYGTGEVWGNSASASFSAMYTGNGVYKSTDNGYTWQSLLSTASNSPESVTYPWDYIWNICTNPAIDTADIVYAAAFGTILRSGDGGETWTTELGAQDCYFTDVAVTASGIVYATLSYESIHKGIWRSTDGFTWTNITPENFSPSFYRIVIGINPSDENEIYFLAETPGSGLLTHDWFWGENWHSLWHYYYLGGDGSGTNGQWTDLSLNLPGTGTSFDRYNSQGSYDMVIKVKPDEPNVVIIGGTNLYRSSDGFSTPFNTSQIGGYNIGSYIPQWSLFLNHHPDQHVLQFLPSNPDVLISANDGGVYRTMNCMDSIVVWEKLNHGYVTSQLYTVGCDLKTTSNIIVAGFQDNGNFFTNSTDPVSNWVMPLNGDGSYMGITENSEYYYLSIQNGKIFKMTIDANGSPTGFARIDPIGGTGYEFINPMVVDPNDESIMYVAGGHNLWRNDILSQLPLAGNYDSISTGWFKYSNTISGYITSLSVSKNPAHVVYYGTSGKHLYKVVGANQGDAVHNDVYYNKFPAAYNSCVAIDPRDADKVLTVFSNYEVYSLFYTDDGGENWTKVGGNLEENILGTGNGPSCRWASIMPFGNQTLYFLGTSVGLFATDKLDSTATEWIQIGAETIGYPVVDMVVARETDGLVLVATHGNGLYSAHVNSVDEIIPAGITENGKKTLHASISPNPANSHCQLFFNLPKSSVTKIFITDNSGKEACKVEDKNLDSGKYYYDIATASLKQGMYYCIIKTSETTTSLKLAIVR